MNDKTEELRDIFTSVTDGDATVTESQEDTRGSLEQDERSVDERLESVVSRMRERYDFETSLSDDDLQVLAKEFYDGATDEEIAAALDIGPPAVFDARLSLHLIRDDDADDIDLVAIRDQSVDDETLAARYDVRIDRIDRYRRVAAATDESRRANDRYRDEFDSILADSDLSVQMTRDVREDGLEDATEGMETDVSF